MTERPRADELAAGIDDKVRKRFKAEESPVRFDSVDISYAHHCLVSSLHDASDLLALILEVEAPATPLSVPNFVWSPYDDSSTPKARDHLEAIIKGLPGCSNRFGRDGFRLVDLRAQEVFQRVRVGNWFISGSVDLLITPFLVVDSSAMRQAVVFFQLSSPDHPFWNNQGSTIRARLSLQLLCACKISSRVPLGIATDLQTRYLVQTVRVIDGKIRIVEGRLAAQEAMELLRTHLLAAHPGVVDLPDDEAQLSADDPSRVIFRLKKLFPPAGTLAYA